MLFSEPPLPKVSPSCLATAIGFRDRSPVDGYRSLNPAGTVLICENTTTIFLAKKEQFAVHNEKSEERIANT